MRALCSLVGSVAFRCSRVAVGAPFAPSKAPRVAPSIRTATNDISSHHTTTIDLGTVKEAKTLFSYPNNVHEEQSLEDTIQHYLSTSIQRDGFSSSDIHIQERDGHILANISGDAASTYAAGLRSFLDAGMMAYRASARVHSEGMWKSNWRFFLPHGVAMTRHHTVQLLHFPPDYTLERDQDYLASRTTRRWGELLIENGVDAEETPRFQNIIDIAPVAAPSGDGRNLEGVYGYYSEFTRTLLQLWGQDTKGIARPIVAFGSPVRKWIQSEFGGPDLDVLDLTTLELGGDLRVPTLVANHPSFVYNVAKRLDSDSDISEEERVSVLTRIMQRDLIAARWQAVMGGDPQSDPSSVLKDSKIYWGDPAKKRRICELARIHGLGQDPKEASRRCATADFDHDLPLFGSLDADMLIDSVVDPDDSIGQLLESLMEEPRS